MKLKRILLLALMGALAPGAQAGVKTVSNNAASPGQYTDLQVAIDAASPNDTIMVAGSGTSYGTITFGKPLVLVGAGHNNPYGSNATVDYMTLTRQNQYVSASGSKIMGFVITSTVYLTGTYTGGVDSTRSINNVVFERCNINYLYFGKDSYVNTFKNDTIRNCLITYQVRLYSGSVLNKFIALTIHNNVFSSSSATGSNYIFGYSGINDLATCSVRNNLFLNHTNTCLSNIKNLTIESNIFYGAEPQGGTTCVYNNNITYMCVNNSIPGTGNTGTGNLVNTDPLFVNFPIAGGAFSCSYDVHLKPASPGKTGGTGGTEIGIYGGTSPAEACANPAFPQMMEISFPSGSSVPAGGVLDVYFKAKKQN